MSTDPEESATIIFWAVILLGAALLLWAGWLLKDWIAAWQAVVSR
jgi:hypothetical protein